MATFPLITRYMRAMSATIRHLLPRQGSSLPIKLIALIIPISIRTASRIRIGTYRLEDEWSTVNL